MLFDGAGEERSFAAVGLAMFIFLILASIESQVGDSLL